ncbi:hypothetical protein VTI74DRAFT_5539 [Chaetomium olivicolor]
MTRLVSGLCLALIDKARTRRILDIGTGTWPISIGDEFPQASVIGNDPSANQTRFVTPNFNFEFDDAEDPWGHGAPFGWIFCRYMAASIVDWPKVVNTIYDNLTPGGYAAF